jgi:hypothetical protein
MTEFVDNEGKPLKGLALVNAQRKAAKAAAAPAAEPASNGKAAAPVAPTGRPKVEPTPAPEPTPEADPGAFTAYDDILDAVKAHDPKFATQHAKETGVQYLVRLLTSVLDVPDSVLPWSDAKNGFETLSDSANDWIRRATAQFQESKTVPLDLEGWADKAVAKGEKPTKEKKAKAEKPAKEPKPKKEKKVKEKKVRPDGFVKRIKRWVVAHYPEGTLKELTDHVETWGPDENGKVPAPATLAVIYSSAREVLALANEAGHWKD